jgi:hypothetical protein
MARLLDPIHPGETLQEDVLKPLGMSVNQLAKKLAVGLAAERYCSRAARDQRRYRPAARALPRHERRILDGAAGRLRPSRGSPAEVEAEGGVKSQAQTGSFVRAGSSDPVRYSGKPVPRAVQILTAGQYLRPRLKRLPLTCYTNSSGERRD